MFPKPLSDSSWPKAKAGELRRSPFSSSFAECSQISGDQNERLAFQQAVLPAAHFRVAYNGRMLDVTQEYP